MIKNFKHKGLANFFYKDSTKGIQTKHKDKLQVLLSALDSAKVVKDMDMPGANLHALKGNLSHLWSVKVNANWRITFEFIDGDAYIVNYEDYH